jgi:hypothetical protein
MPVILTSPDEFDRWLEADALGAWAGSSSRLAEGAGLGRLD